jgi:hypothetical protein
MPNRIMKDSICTSPNIDQLSRDAEVFFYRLIVQCDDFGRMDARLPILRAKCYPLQIDRVSQDDIRAWLAELANACLVTLYTVDGADYLQMRTWDRHQQIRAKRSKYPDMQSSDINCNQVISDAPVIQSNPITNVPADAGSADAERTPVPALSGASLTEQFHEHLEHLKDPQANRPAILHSVYALCFGEAGAPDYGYLGSTAKKVGGAGRLAQLMFELVTRPPVGDVLAYIVAEENARKKRAKFTGENREISEVKFSTNGGDIYA